MKRGPDQKAILPPHLTDAQIIALLDGELPEPDHQNSKSHLGSCWVCRSRAGAIESSIESFVRTRQSLLPEPTVFDESRVGQFRQRLGRHAREADAGLGFTDRLLDRCASWMTRLGSQLTAHRQAAIATVMIACIVVVMFTDVLNTRVSADTILTRTEKYESAHSARPGQVTRTSLRVERIEHRDLKSRSVANITLIHDSQGPTYVSGQANGASLEFLANNSGALATNLLRSVFSADASDSQVLQYLSSRQWDPEVSAASFRNLVSDRGSKETSVSRVDSLVQLHYLFAPGHVSGISEAMLTVDATDFSPAQLSISSGTKENGLEYRFTRTSYQVEPREAEVAHLGSVDMGASASGRPVPASPTRKASPLSYLNTPATSEEVAAAAALHKADACLGEEIYLFPMSDGSLLVQGLVDGAARRTAIRESLKGISGPLRIELFVPRELKNGSELYAPPDEFAGRVPPGGSGNYTATLADLSSAKMPLYDQLYKHFAQTGTASDGINKQVAIFSNEVVTLARQTFLHAWALKKLDREFSGQRTGKLDAATLARVEEMREDHRRWISNLAHQQAEMLGRVSDAPVVAGLSGTNPAQDSTALLRLAQEQNDLVRSLFTSSTATPETSGSLSRLLSVLHQMGS